MHKIWVEKPYKHLYRIDRFFACSLIFQLIRIVPSCDWLCDVQHLKFKMRKKCVPKMLRKRILSFFFSFRDSCCFCMTWCHLWKWMQIAFATFRWTSHILSSPVIDLFIYATRAHAFSVLVRYFPLESEPCFFFFSVSIL